MSRNAREMKDYYNSTTNDILDGRVVNNESGPKGKDSAASKSSKIINSFHKHASIVGGHQAQPRRYKSPFGEYQR